MKTLFLILSILVITPALAQNEAEAEIKAVIDQLFEGMRRGDSSMVRAVFHPQASLRTSFVHYSSGKPMIHAEAIDGFVEAVGTPHKEVWDERTTNYVFHVDDNLAQVWMDYSFYLNDHLEHCGVNSVQLMRVEDGWKITDIADTRRKQGCIEMDAH